MTCESCGAELLGRTETCGSCGINLRRTAVAGPVGFWPIKQGKGAVRAAAGINFTLALLPLAAAILAVDAPADQVDFDSETILVGFAVPIVLAVGLLLGNVWIRRVTLLWAGLAVLGGVIAAFEADAVSATILWAYALAMAVLLTGRGTPVRTTAGLSAFLIPAAVVAVVAVVVVLSAEELPDLSGAVWSEFSPPDRAFLVSMPGFPTDTDLSNAYQTGHMYEVRFRNAEFAVSYVSAPDISEESGARSRLYDVRERTRASARGTITADRNSVFEGHPGREFTIEAEFDGNPTLISGRAIVIDSRMYLLLALSQNMAVSEDQTRMFFDSFISRVNQSGLE